MKLKIFTDGGSRNNPGKAGIGYVIYDEDGNTLFEEGRYIGIQTNNVAEYTALLESLKKVKGIIEKGPSFWGTNVTPESIRAQRKDSGSTRTTEEVSSIEYYLDSNLIVQQMNGKFKIKAQHLLPIIQEIREIQRTLPPMTFQHVYRDKNKRADLLVNQALDKNM